MTSRSIFVAKSELQMIRKAHPPCHTRSHQRDWKFKPSYKRRVCRRVRTLLQTRFDATNAAISDDITQATPLKEKYLGYSPKNRSDARDPTVS